MELSTFAEDLEHFEHGEFLHYNGPTWWLWDEPGLNILETAGDGLDDMFERLQVRPNKISDTDERIFEARYEMLTHGGTSKYPEAFLLNEAYGFVDFVIGIPYGCIERIGVGWESAEDSIGVLDSGDRSVPPLLDDLFEEKEGMSLIYDRMWLDFSNTKSFAVGLSGASPLVNHWWFRFNLIGMESKSPIPGEFLFLALFLMPNEAWGWQDSNPTIFSGNWIETLFYTSGVVETVLGDGSYTVRYRGTSITAVSSDWADYAVEDRVAILRNVDSGKESFTWEDMEEFQAEWRLAPITFYEGG